MGHWTLGKMLNLIVPPFPHLENGDNNSYASVNVRMFKPVDNFYKNVFEPNKQRMHLEARSQWTEIKCL